VVKKDDTFVLRDQKGNPVWNWLQLAILLFLLAAPRIKLLSLAK
jgi:hypothetical protein